MTSSKDKAAKVALDRSGLPGEVTTDGAVTDSARVPVAKVLKPGDTVVEADGLDSANQDWSTAISATSPARRSASRLEPLGDASPSRRSTAELVAVPTTTKPSSACAGRSAEVRLPLRGDDQFRPGRGSLGGPGLHPGDPRPVTPGDLTGGEPVAVTGTIELDGSVGPVGGVSQKTEAAIGAGAGTFSSCPAYLVRFTVLLNPDGESSGGSRVGPPRGR